MSLIGEFHKGEIDGKPYLLYHEVIKPLPQITLSDEETTIDKPLSIQNKTNSSDKLAIDSGDDLIPLPHLFLSPLTIINSTNDTENINVRNEYGNGRSGFCSKFHTSPLVGDNLLGSHVVLLPLYWCNNKEADPENDCSSCRAPKVGTHYYYCVDCDQRYHKECVASPLEINYPYHVKHSLQLSYSTKKYKHCILCTEKADLNLYYSSLSDIYMHVHCAQAPIPFFIDQPKRHDHTLNLFPRQASLTCNVCALVNKHSLTYVCTSCDFVAHSHCIHIPQTIRISRHYHRVSFTSFLQPGKWSCGVCRQKVDRDYGAYTCNVCSDYAVHTRCALRLDIWDGIELEGVPEEDEDVEPFERISDGIILHFSHGCHLKFGTNGVYDENKFCQACTLSINEENFYVCVECDFMLHERCADAPRKKFHPLHPHPLEQKVVDGDYPLFGCEACARRSTGFKYECANQNCNYTLDVVCASTSEPFDYQGHQHPLFLALDPQEKPICHICKSAEDVQNVFNCIEFQCDFIICFKCATLPYLVRYKHDEHYLTFCRGDEASGSDWCELCEGKLAIGGKEGFYKCNDCCTTLHINCLLGPDPYLKPFKDGELSYQRNNSATRPICKDCNSRCQYPTFVVNTEDMVSYFLCTFFNHP